MQITEALRILQFGDTMLPVGAFSFSAGLEAAVQVGLVHDFGSLREFVLTSTVQAAGVDGVALLVAHRAARVDDLPRVMQADAALLNRKLGEEMRTMAVRMGRKLAELAARVFEAGMARRWLAEILQGATPGTYAVGQGVVFADLGLAEDVAFAAQQYGVATMILGAALRLMRIDHLDTQAILFEVNQKAGDAYARVAGCDLSGMAAYTPALDILAAVHVKSHVRLFMN